MRQQVQRLRGIASFIECLDGMHGPGGAGSLGVLCGLDGLLIARTHEYIGCNRGCGAQQDLRAQCNAHAGHLSRVKTTNRTSALTCVSPTTLRSMLSLSRPAAGMWVSV